MKSYLNERDPCLIVAARRDELGLTQAELAKKLGYPNVSFISMMESKRSRVPLDKAIEIAKALEIDDVWFIEKIMRQRFPGAAERLFAASGGRKIRRPF